MMCGICGVGKTTYAKVKEQEGYIRLSIDEEMWKVYGKKVLIIRKNNTRNYPDMWRGHFEKDCYHLLNKEKML